MLVGARGVGALERRGVSVRDRFEEKKRLGSGIEIGRGFCAFFGGGLFGVWFLRLVFVGLRF